MTEASTTLLPSAVETHHPQPSAKASFGRHRNSGISGVAIDTAPTRFWRRAQRRFSLVCAACCVMGVVGSYSLDLLAWLIIFASAAISSVAGFAFSPLAGSLLFHSVPDTAHAVQIMLVASIAIQLYSVAKLRKSISISALVPYFIGGSLTVVPGVYLLLNTPVRVFLIALGGFLVAYASYMLVRRPFQLKSNSLIARVGIGALGGITGATAAFPGAFITIWCSLHGWEKEHQRAIYQPYILGMQLLALVALAAVTSGEMMRLELLHYAAPALLGAYVGLRIFSKLSTPQFNAVVSAFLLLSGLLLSARAL